MKLRDKMNGMNVTQGRHLEGTGRAFPPPPEFVGKNCNMHQY